MNALRFLFALVFFAVPVLAQETYEIRLTRPVKTGDRFKLTARVAFQSETTSKTSGEPVEEEKVNAACELEGEITIVAVTKKGMPKEIQFKLDAAKSFDDGEPAELFKSGDVIVMKHGADKDDIRVNGEEAGETESELIDALLSVATDDEATDDEAFGTKDKVKVGDEWKANSEVLAAEMARQNLEGLKPGDFKATARLAETTKVDGQPALRVVSEMKFESTAARLPNLEDGLKTNRVNAEVRSEMDVPVDVAALATHARTTMKFEFEARGKVRDEEGLEIPMRVSVKRRTAVDATEVPLK
jgi:hypothetical protein